MKKWLFLLLSVLMTVIMLSIGTLAVTAAADAPVIAVSDVTGKQGSTVDVTVNLKDNPGVQSAKVKVLFDNTVLELQSYKVGNFAESGYSWGDKDKANKTGSFIINWCDAIHDPSTAELLATLTFKVKADAALGTYEVGLTYDEEDVFTAGFENVYFSTDAGSVKVLCAHKYDHGCDPDCNKCGEARSKWDHDYEKKVTKATLTKDGVIKNVCERCGYVASKTTTIAKVKSVAFKKATTTYDGKTKKPSVVVKDSKGNTISSSYYTVTYPSGMKAAGTYSVKVTMKGNYSGTKTLTYTINPIDVSTCKVSFKKATATYDGKVKTPTVVVKNASGTTLTKGTHYTVTYPSGMKNAGTYKVKVTMKGNYSGTKTLTYTINPAKISSYKLSTTSYTYNGKAKTPSVTVKNANGTTLTKDTHYTVTYASGRKNVGTYKVTIKGKGNYTGSKTLTFKINPAKTSVSSLTAGKKALTVKWSKKSTQVTGYEIQYSTSKSFSEKYTNSKVISSYKTTSTTLKSLSAGKTYYVRVRTYKVVDGKKYYSDWSTVKYTKTK